MEKEVRVYRFQKGEYSKLQALVSRDHFARNGYTVQEGKTLGSDFDGYYLYIKATREFFDAHEKEILEAGGEKVSGPEYDLVKDAIEKQEENVAAGLSLFG